MWDVSTGQLRAVLRGHSDYVRAVAVSPDGQILVTGSGDETIKLWDLASESELCTLTGHRGQVFCLAVEPGGRLLASGSEDHTIRLWDIRQRNRVATLEGHAARYIPSRFLPTEHDWPRPAATAPSSSGTSRHGARSAASLATQSESIR